jgi:hypothetical protein
MPLPVSGVWDQNARLRHINHFESETVFRDRRVPVMFVGGMAFAPTIKRVGAGNEKIRCSS